LLATNLYFSFKKLWYSLYFAPFVLFIGITCIYPCKFNDSLNETETPIIATIIFAISSFVICSTQAINFLQGTLLALLVAAYVVTLSIIQYKNGQEYITDYYLVLNSADNYVRVYTSS